MDRDYEIQLAANKIYPLSNNREWVEDTDMKNEAFMMGAEWADNNPKKIDAKCETPKEDKIS